MELDARRLPKTVVCLGQRSPETKQVFSLLAKRRALRIVHVPCLESLALALRGLPASLVVIGPEVSEETLLKVFANGDNLHQGVPVVALRLRVDEGWVATLPGFTVALHPFPVAVLLRLVEMALDASLPPEVERADSGMPS
jgi:hypothetical protein